jgi:hypothetical protein
LTKRFFDVKKAKLFGSKNRRFFEKRSFFLISEKFKKRSASSQKTYGFLKEFKKLRLSKNRRFYACRRRRTEGQARKRRFFLELLKKNYVFFERDELPAFDRMQL